MTHRRNKYRRGATMTEVVMSTLLVGILMVSALTTVGAVVRTRGINSLRVHGPTLAHQLMSEVLQGSYEDADTTPVFGPEVGESTANRGDFDDVDDYNDWSENPPAEKDGTAIAGYTGWLCTVDVQKIEVASHTALPDVSLDTGLRQITVTITDPVGEVTTLSAYRCDAGVVEQPVGVDTTFVTGVTGELQIGGQASSVIAGANIVNHARDQ